MIKLFSLSKTIFYVPVVTLSAKDNQKLSKLLSKGFKRLVSWNKYKTKSENKLCWSQQIINPKRFKTGRYYLPKGKIKSYKAIINQAINSDIKQ